MTGIQIAEEINAYSVNPKGGWRHGSMASHNRGQCHLFWGQKKEETDTFCLQRTIQRPFLVSSQEMVLQGAVPVCEPTGMQQLSGNMWVVLTSVCPLSGPNLTLS